VSMSQVEITRIAGSWKALFIGPNAQIRRDLIPLLSRHLQTLSTVEMTTFPSRQQLIATLATQSPNLCFIEVGDSEDLGVNSISEITRIDPKLPVVVILSGNDANLVMRCLRQGAIDFLFNPFTNDQVEGAMQKLAKALPNLGSAKPAKTFAVMPVKGGCGASTIACNLAYQWKRLGSNACSSPTWIRWPELFPFF